MKEHGFVENPSWKLRTVLTCYSREKKSVAGACIFAISIKRRKLMAFIRDVHQIVKKKEKNDL